MTAAAAQAGAVAVALVSWAEVSRMLLNVFS